MKILSLAALAVALLVGACAPQPDPRLARAIAGAENDGASEIGLTMEKAELQGARPLSAQEARFAVTGNTLVSRWRSGRIVQHAWHQPSGVRLDHLEYLTAGFANGVSTLWYIDANGQYCETDASRRNCGPLWFDGVDLIWFSSYEPAGQFGTRLEVLSGNALPPGGGPVGPTRPAPVAEVNWPGVGRASGPAEIYTMVVRDEPRMESATFEAPHPRDPTLRCAAIRHPDREAELRCPDGLNAIADKVGGGITDPEPARMTAPDGTQVTLTVR